MLGNAVTKSAFIVTLLPARLRSEARNGRPTPQNVNINNSDDPVDIRAFASQRQNASDVPWMSDSSTNQIACPEIT